MKNCFFSNGLLVEWGYDKESSSTTYIDFHVAFNTCFGLVATIANTGSNAIDIKILTNTHFQFKAGTNWSNDYIYWIAVGY